MTLELPDVVNTAQAPSRPPASPAPTGSSYIERDIVVTFKLGQGAFGNNGYNTLTLEGLRVSAQIAKVTLPGAGLASVHIYGMTLDQINTLTKAGTQWLDVNNLIIIRAGDSSNGLSTIFIGNIWEAYPEFGSAPNTAFVVTANPAGNIQLKPVAPSSYKGATDAATAIGRMAKQAGLGFENNGVNVQLADPYFPGTIWTQIKTAVAAANAYAHLDSATNTLAIWPKTGPGRGGAIPLIAPETGMIGYPEFQRQLVKVRTLFDPAVKAGGQIRIRSQLKAANGTFQATSIDYNLSARMPDGPWEMMITAWPPNTSAGAPA